MDNETKEMFHLLLEKINSIDERTQKTDLRLNSIDERTQKTDLRLDSIDERLNSIDERTKKTDLRLENTIEPRLQLVLEQHSTTAKKLEKLDKIENKLDDVASDVDVIKEVITKHRGEIDRVKKQA